MDFATVPIIVFVMPVTTLPTVHNMIALISITTMALFAQAKVLASLPIHVHAIQDM